MAKSDRKNKFVDDGKGLVVTTPDGKTHGEKKEKGGKKASLSHLIRLASTLPLGSPERVAALSVIVAGGGLRTASNISLSRTYQAGKMTFAAGSVYAHVWFDSGVAADDYGRRVSDSGEWQVIVTTSEDPLNLRPRGRELTRQTFRYADPQMRGLVQDQAEKFIKDALFKYSRRLASVKVAHRLDGVRGHKLMPANIKAKIPNIGGQEHEPDPMVWVKYFSPYSQAVWFVTEFDGQDEMFGWADLGMGGGELGYISLAELEGVNRRGLPLVERDTSFRPKPLSQAKRGD